MRTWVLWFFLVLGLMAGTTVQAVPVGGITDTQGNAVGMQDAPVRGDNPWKLHQHYCAETTTLAAVQSAILQPNGLKNARRMPVGKRIDVRCREVRASYRESQWFGSSLKTLVQETSHQIQALEQRITRLEERVASVQGDVQRVPQTVQELVSSSAAPWWRDIGFWTLLLLMLLLLAMSALAVILVRSDQRSRRFIEAYKVSPPARSSDLWLEPLPDNSFSIYILAFEDGEARGRLFRFDTRQQQPAKLYPDVFGKQWPSAYDAGQEMSKVLNRYVTHTSSVHDRQEIERALREGTLVEMERRLRHS